jgi:hypothetical protein
MKEKRFCSTKIIQVQSSLWNPILSVFAPYDEEVREGISCSIAAAGSDFAKGEQNESFV